MKDKKWPIFEKWSKFFHANIGLFLKTEKKAVQQENIE